jgi:outer membrane protein OmpA-like peptidoglycan-associated protein
MKKCFTFMGAALLSVSLAAAQEVPRFQTYFGYDYARMYPSQDLPQFRASGGNMQLVYNFNKWLSGVADLGALHNNSFAGFAIDNTTWNYVFGPRISIRKWSRFTPFVQALFGGAYYSASAPLDGFVPANNGILPLNPLLPEGTPITGRITSHQNGFAMLAGGGVDIKLTKHISFRPAEVDYYETRIQDLGQTADRLQNNFRYTAGFAFNFGGEKHVAPPPPAARQVPRSLTLQLTPSSTQVCPGETVTVNATIAGANPNELKHVWYVNGQPISQGQSFSFGTEGRQPGTYTISLALNGPNFNPAQAETKITVLQYTPPTGTVSANPAQIEYGDKAALSSNFQGQCGKCAIQTPTYTASEGAINGNEFDSTGVQFSPNSSTEQHKTVTITANASDCTSNGTATTTVDVIKKATIAPVRLPDVLFNRNSSRVNNCGKRVLLEQLRAYVEKDPSGTVVLVGNQSPDETVSGLDMKRVENAAAVITSGTGVCMSVPQSQVMVQANGANQSQVSLEPGFCSSSVRGTGSDEDMRRVAVWFVPSGGQMPAMVSNLQNAQTLNISGLGCPR